VSWGDPSSGDWGDPDDQGERPWDDRGEQPWGESEGAWDEPDSPRWPLDWRGLYPRERWLWFDQLWSDVVMLRDRYRLAVRAGWWENDVQLEALAAVAAWVSRYDSGEWDDPPGKLALLYDLERVAALLRDGLDPFSPDRDRPEFERHLVGLGCVPPGPSPNGRVAS
jgi:hypothetical protein